MLFICPDCSSNDIGFSFSGHSVCNNCSSVVEFFTCLESNKQVKDCEYSHNTPYHHREKYLLKKLISFDIPSKFHDYVISRFSKFIKNYKNFSDSKNFTNYAYFIHKILLEKNYHFKYPKFLKKSLKKKYDDSYFLMFTSLGSVSSF